MDFYNTNISKESFLLANEVLSSTYLSAGKMAARFEIELSRKLGLVNPVSVNSGTSALHLALSVAKIGKGDEVILSPQTFVATGMVILMQGAKAVFADIQYETGNIDPSSIKDKITSKTKAILPVHWGGYPCDMDEINEIASKNGAAVIEDAAHALGAKYKNKPIGSISKFTAFSFQAIKHLTTGDGGALCCKNKDNYELAKKSRWFGIDRENSSPSILGERIYDINEIGYKYHLNDLASAIGLGNLQTIDNIVNKHIAIADKYKTELKDIPGLKLLDYSTDRQSSYWLFTVLVEKREDFIRALKDRGVPTSVVHQRIDRNSIFGITPGLYNQEKFDSHQISIPIHNGLTESDVEQVINAIKEGW
jgi:perosamine synthetase